MLSLSYFCGENVFLPDVKRIIDFQETYVNWRRSSLWSFSPNKTMSVKKPADFVSQWQVMFWGEDGMGVQIVLELLRKSWFEISLFLLI